MKPIKIFYWAIVVLIISDLLTLFEYFLPFKIGEVIPRNILAFWAIFPSSIEYFFLIWILDEDDENIEMKRTVWVLIIGNIFEVLSILEYDLFELSIRLSLGFGWMANLAKCYFIYQALTYRGKFFQQFNLIGGAFFLPMVMSGFVSYTFGINGRRILNVWDFLRHLIELYTFLPHIAILYVLIKFVKNGEGSLKDREYFFKNLHI